MKKYIIGSLIIASLLVLGACSTTNMNGHDMSKMNGNENQKTKNEKKLNLNGLKEGQPILHLVYLGDTR
ncbi:hypothetical protein [Gottfriedia solisilvae]|uniref:hypothetical protein n=1 Tax=Gottfriedia solisilvae TaxID=1516104 RepID=UPI003D2EBF00